MGKPDWYRAHVSTKRDVAYQNTRFVPGANAPAAHEFVTRQPRMGARKLDGYSAIGFKTGGKACLRSGDDLLEENDEALRQDLDLIGVPEKQVDDMRLLPPVSHGVECLAVS
jgi:hypothetical protein